MPKNTRAIRAFRDFVGCSEREAISVLSMYQWDVERAIDAFYNNPNAFRKGSKGKCDRTKLKQVYDSFADKEDPEALFDETLREYLNFIGANPDRIDALAVFWQLDASEVGEIKEEEFMEGWASLGVDSVDQMKAKVVEFIRMLDDMKHFKRFYNWLFGYLKENKKKRTIPKSLGISIWKLILDPFRFPLVEEYSKFLENQDNEAFTKDLWEQSIDFIAETSADFSNYDEDGAWPVVIDEFVRTRRKEDTMDTL